MKCEICHQREAETAISTDGDDTSELYVCKECARAERVRRQKKRERTRKDRGIPPGLSISVAGFGPADEPPPFIEALMNAVTNAFSPDASRKGDESRQTPGRKNQEKENGEAQAKEDGRGKGRSSRGSKADAGDPGIETPLDNVDANYILRGALQLEGMHLTGELSQAVDAVDKLGMKLEGVEAEGISGVAHAYRLMHSGDERKARRVLREIVYRERSAREALRDEMRRTYQDALCRSLAILKNCRFLSPGEYADLLSPLRMGAADGLLDGIDFDEINNMIESLELDSGAGSSGEFQENFDEIDAATADRANARFEDVVLSDAAEDLFK